MKQTYCMPALKIVLLDSEDAVRTSGIESVNDFKTFGQYDGSNIWNGF